MKPSEEKLDEFNSRVNTWISKQGLVFQLTHGGTGLGGRPPVVGALIRTLLSVLLLALLGAAGYAGFLIWKGSSKNLPETLAAGISDGLNVEEVNVVRFERASGKGSFREVFAQGDENSFFNTLSCYQIQFPMALTDGIFSTWEADKLSISRLTADLKAGAIDDTLAHECWSGLFTKRPSFEFKTVEVKNTNLSWGYASAPTWGQIKESSLLALRNGNGWDLTFQGGSFSQGIFRDFGIVEMKVTLDAEEGLQITKAECTTPQGGLFTWSAKMVEGGASPTFSYQGEFSNIPIAMFVPHGLLPAINGQISGTLTGEGSTNNESGISFDIQATPGSEEPIYLTSEFSLLRILGQLDPENSYRKIPFNEGSFRIQSEGQQLTFSDIKLLSHNLEAGTVIADLRGEFSARPSTPEDLSSQSLILRDLSEATPSATIGEAPVLDTSFEEEAQLQFKELQFINPPTQYTALTQDKEGEDLKRKRIEETLRRAFRPPFMIQGELKLAVSPTAFTERTDLPGVVLPQGSEKGFAEITIPLENFVLTSTENLSSRWEESLSERR